MRARIVLAAVVALILQTGAALAHATMIASEPSDGAILDAAPSHIVLVFNEPVSPLVLRLIDDKGMAIDLPHHVEGNAVTGDLPPRSAHGSHTVSWRVISTDGHPVGGSLLFAVGAPSTGGASGVTSATDPLVAMATWLCRLIIYAALFGGVGGVFFTTVVARCGLGASALAIQRTLLAAALVAESVSAGLQGLDALGLPLSAIADGPVWRTAMGTTYGTTALIALVAIALALAATFGVVGSLRRGLAALSFLGVGAALAASGHASAASPQWLTRPALFIHAVAVTFWLGALLPLAVLLRSGGGSAALARFSRAIPFVLIALVAAGIALAVVQVQEPDALWSTSYGRVLLVKLALVAVLFALAAFNRWRLTASAEAGIPAAQRRLVAAIVVEVVLALAILGTVALWRFTPPPRSLLALAGHPVSVHIHTEKAMADVSFSPGHAGPVRASIFVMTGDFTALEAKEVTLSISSLSLGIEPISRPAHNLGGGSWEIDDLVIPAPGKWDVEVAVLISEFELIRLKETIDVGASRPAL